MTLIVADRVLETSTTTGTGALTLAGAVAGFRAFSTVCTSPSDTCYYHIEAVNSSGVPTGEWETGLGTYSAANTLTRTAPAAGSATTPVSFSAGTKRVCISHTAEAYSKNREFWDTFEPTGGSANTGSFGSRGGLVIPTSNIIAHSLVFRFTADAAVAYDGQIVTLDGSNVVQAIEATATLAAGLPTTAYGYHIFDFTTPFTLVSGTTYGVLCTRNTTSGSSAWTMRGSAASGVMMQAGFLTIDTYIRNTTNTVSVSDTYTSGANSYWFGIKVTPV